MLQIAPMVRETQGDVMELGAGSGKLAVDVLLELERQCALPTRYTILEVSADLQARQFNTLSTHAPHLIDRVTWVRKSESNPISRNVAAGSEASVEIPESRSKISTRAARVRRTRPCDGGPAGMLPDMLGST